MNCSKVLAKRTCQAIALGVMAASLLEPVHGAAQEPRGTRGEKPNPNEKANPNAAAIKAFVDRVKAYVDLQKKVDDGLPKLTGDDNPSKIEAHQAAMAGRIKLARATAKSGDIFGTAGPIIRAVIREDANLRTLRDARAAMEEVPKYDPPKVNAAYPEKAALATVPPLILNALPRLPEGVEYRFMGNDLILRDTKANLIADILNDAVPAQKGK